MFTYTEEKKFTKEQVQQLFLSVNWISGKYPERLYKALMNSSTVLTVWDEKKLIGLTRVLDDSEMLAQIHYVLVDPDYQGMGIAGKMIEYIKEKYKDFMYIDGMPEDKKNVPFYQKHGFSLMENGAAIQICKSKVIDIMDENGVYWQTGELGAVDVGGGGTIAMFVAAMDVDVVDLGVPILSMHAPFELASKLDVYNTYRAFAAFYK